MTIPELRMLYKRETGQKSVMENGRRVIDMRPDYRVFTDYFNWLEEKLAEAKTIEKQLIPWEHELRTGHKNR